MALHKDHDVPQPRLILLTQWFDPEPTFKGLVFARALVARGFDVEVVTGFPNYPGGKVYDGYRIRPIQREEMQGIKVTRLPLYPSHDRSTIRRILNYGTFFLSAAWYLTTSARRADVLYAYHPPLTVGMAALVAKIFRRTPTVLDIQDLWPDSLGATGMVNRPRFLNMVGGMCIWVYQRVDKIAVLSPGFKRTLIQRGVPEAKIAVVYNWADENSIADVNGVPKMPQGADTFQVLFAGNMGLAQGLDTVLDAAAILKDSAGSVEFCFLGGGLDLERLKTRAIAEELSNVRFLPKVPMKDVGPYLAAADCLLVHLTADPLFEITIPSKTQAYMAAGKPLIMAVPGDAAQLVEDSKAGVVIPPENATALASAVRHLAGLDGMERQGMGMAGKKYYRDHLSLAKGAEAFEGLFNEIGRHAIKARGGACE